MNKKSLFASLLSVFIWSCIFGYSLVFSVFGNNIELYYTLSSNIYTDSLSLNKTRLVFRSSGNLENYRLVSECNIFTNFLWNQRDLYLYEVKFLDDSCYNKTVSLVNENSEVIVKEKFQIHSEYSLYERLLDYDSKILSSLVQKLDEEMNKYSQYVKKWIKEEGDYNVVLKNKRKLEELQYNRNFIQWILSDREKKYRIPVDGYTMELPNHRLPNAARPYRQAYTDGIHHGWDVGSQKGELIKALDNGIIVRVVNNFQESDFNAIVYGNNLTSEQRIKNLDILRGNQVWIKTAKWDVVFYSHLDNVFSHIKEGMVIRRWDLVGTIWATGVPGTGYDDYHLHFPIHKNPYNMKRAGKYNIEDYMKWGWYFKWKSREEVIEGTKEVFN